MISKNIIFKGTRYGLNVLIDLNGFKNFNEMLEEFFREVDKKKNFFTGSVITFTLQLDKVSKDQLESFKIRLLRELDLKDCIFKDSEPPKSKSFSGIYEGRTKFYRNTIRSGQILEYNGNVVILGDVNPGAEIYAAGNIIVMGALRGDVHAGTSGNTHAIIAAYKLQPKIIQIGELITRTPDDDEKPGFPEVAKVKDGIIIVEPYVANKFI